MASYTLHPYQQDAVNNLNLLAEELESFSTILTIPTGGGKTLTALDFINNTILTKGKKVLWLANSTYLVGQAVKTLSEKVNNTISVAKVEAGRKVFEFSKDTQFTAMTYQYVNSHKDEVLEFFKDQDILLVIDEAHHACAASYRDIIEKLSSVTKSFSMLGLTATPFRTSDEETPYLAVLFPDGVTNGVVDDSSITYSIGLNDLISMGYLARPLFHCYEIDFGNKLICSNTSDKTDIREVEDYRISQSHCYDVNSGNEIICDVISTKADINEVSGYPSTESYCEVSLYNESSSSGAFGAVDINEVECQLAEDKIYNKGIIDIYLSHAGEYKKTIIFAINQKHAVTLWQLLLNNGVKAGLAISADISDYDINRKVIDANIESFRDEEGLDVLITCKMLNEGFDVPDTKTVILTKPITSKIECTQCVGRALRKKVGDNTANIVYFKTYARGCSVNWVTPDSIIKGEYKFSNFAFDACSQADWKNISEYMQDVIKATKELEVVINGIVSSIKGLFFYKDIYGRVQQVSTCTANHDQFLALQDNLDKLKVEEIESIVSQLYVDEMNVPITSSSILDILTYYKNTGNKPVMYECNEALNNLLDLSLQAKGIEDVPMKEGKNILSQIWGSELILQYRYPDAGSFTSAVIEKM